MAQIQTKFIANLAVTAAKLASGAATASQALFADGSGNAAYRSILSTDIPTISGSQVSGGTFGAVNGSALTNLSAAALSGVLPVGVTGGSGLSIASTQLTGQVAIANGGTGQATAAAAYNALSPMTTAGDLEYEISANTAARLGIGSTGQVLTVVAGLPAWAPTGAASLTNNHIFVGNASNVATDVAMSGEASIVASGAVTLSNAAVIAKVLTGYTSGAGTITSADSILSAIEKLNGNDALYLPLAGGTMSGAINMGGNQINNLANGTSSGDAINLGQLQAAIAGLYWQGPAQAYAASNVPLTGGATLTIDGYSVQNGNLVILGNQTTASQNGEYTVSGIGSTYVLTPNGLPTAAGDAWLILNGTVYADSAFVANAAVPSATFTEFAGPTAYTFTAPLSLSGRTVSITQASGSSDGYLSSTDWNTFNNKQPAGNYITALTGDATASGPGSAALTLATVATAGTTGSSTSIPSITINAKGLVTSVTGNAVVAPAGTLSGTTLNSSVVSSSLTSVGTITSGTWNGTTIAIANGGTGQTTASAAFDALSPITATGDLIVGNGTDSATNLPIGSPGQVLTVVSGTAAWASAAYAATTTEDIFTLNSTDITNQYKDLSHPATGSSATVNSISLDVVGGPEQLKGIDYTVSLTGGAGGVTRITFAGGLATAGASALVSGDILMIKYAY